MNVIVDIGYNIFSTLLDASPFIVMGLFISGFITVFLSPDSISTYLGVGKIRSVFNASLFGIPLPLCSCGVLPAAVSLKKQGANNGAVTSFLISTPESGIDSIVITYALIDPIMTIARPVAAFIMAFTAGLIENFSPESVNQENPQANNETCHQCQCSQTCSDELIESEFESCIHESNAVSKIKYGLTHGFITVWFDMDRWFYFGVILAGMITILIPDEIFQSYLGGGLQSMLLMLIIGIPIYICASASTPIVAALILKGMSPGAALVFLLAGPATNITSLTVLMGILGHRATIIYLSTIAVLSLIFGMLLDSIYQFFSIIPSAHVGQSSSDLSVWIKVGCAILLIGLSIIKIVTSKNSQ